MIHQKTILFILACSALMYFLFFMHTPKGDVNENFANQSPVNPETSIMELTSQNSTVVTASKEINITGPTDKLAITPELPNETVTKSKINVDIPDTPNDRFQLIFDIYDENNLTLETCARIQSDTNDFMTSDEQFLELGFQYKPGSDYTLEYEKLTNDELDGLIDINDVVAMHVLGNRIIRDKNLLDKAEVILQRAMINGSISAASALRATFYNMANNDKSLTEEQKQAMHAKSVFYDAFAEYRIGRLDLSQFDNEEARELERFVIALNQKRAEIGLDEFQNFQYPSWPQVFREECDRLISEYNSNNRRDFDSH